MSTSTQKEKQQSFIMYNHFSPKYFHPIFRNPGFWFFNVSNLHDGWDGCEKNPPFRTPLGFLLNNWSLGFQDGFQGVALVVEKAVLDFVFEAQKHLDFRHQTLQFLPKKNGRHLKYHWYAMGSIMIGLKIKESPSARCFQITLKLTSIFLKICWLSPEALCEIMGPSKESVKI